MRLVDIFKAKVLDVTKSSMILEITGDNDKVTATLRLLEDMAYWSWFAPAWSRSNAATK